MCSHLTKLPEPAYAHKHINSCLCYPSSQISLLILVLWKYKNLIFHHIFIMMKDWPQAKVELVNFKLHPVSTIGMCFSLEHRTFYWSRGPFWDPIAIKHLYLTYSSSQRYSWQILLWHLILLWEYVKALEDLPGQLLKKRKEINCEES